MNWILIGVSDFENIITALVGAILLFIIVSVALIDNKRTAKAGALFGVLAIVMIIFAVAFVISTPPYDDMRFIELDQIKAASPTVYKCDQEKSYYCRSQIAQFKEDSMKAEVNVEKVLNKHKIKVITNVGDTETYKAKLDSVYEPLRGK
jgi:hypothetical protein